MSGKTSVGRPKEHLAACDKWQAKQRQERQARDNAGYLPSYSEAVQKKITEVGIQHISQDESRSFAYDAAAAVIAGGRPFSLFESRRWRYFFTPFKPGWKPPSRAVITRILPDTYVLEAAGSEPNSTKKVRTSLIKEAFNKAGEIEVTKLQEREEQVLRNVLNPKAAMEALVQLVTVRNLPYNCNTWPELHALLMAANYTAEELINTSHGHVQKLCSNSYAIHEDILRKKLQSSPAKLHLSADVWSAPNHKAFLGICVQFMQEGTKNPCQALLALPELPGIDGPGSHSGAEQWKLLQPVIEEYGISRQLGYITGDNHGSNDVLCRLLSHFLDGRGVAWNARHRRIRCHGHIVNLCVQAFLFMDSKEAVLEACRQIEEMDQASFNIDMMQGWKKRKERGWSQLSPLGKLHNTAIHIRANDYRYNLFRRRAGKVLGLDNDTRWNSWFLLLDAALNKEEHIKWYQDKYYDALVDDYLAPQDWQNLRETQNFLQPF
ncbi:hypothetical protein FOFC_02988 [Fusarium oxysporum]|nr:hypothetical protein FOFC_02988 [Fusarium oxysporum]